MKLDEPLPNRMKNATVHDVFRQTAVHPVDDDGEAPDGDYPDGYPPDYDDYVKPPNDRGLYISHNDAEALVNFIIDQGYVSKEFHPLVDALYDRFVDFLRPQS